MSMTIDGRTMPTCSAFHQQIAETLGFPDYYGKNLDALHDCLTDLPAGTALRFVRFSAFRDAVGESYALRVLRVLRHAADEAELKIEIEE